MGQRNSPWRYVFFRSFFPVVVGISLALLLHKFAFLPITVENNHMGESYPKGKLVFVRTFFSTKSLLVGDVVCVQPKDFPGKYFLGRVLGKPGDRIQVSNRNPLRNGIPLEQKIFPVTKGTNIPTMPAGKSQMDHLPVSVVPEKHFFVLSDNLEEGFDSREYGMVSDKEILGKVW